uniref:Uncharacterized protein n=1 Tax=Gibberella zeae TaxID=5518 RepID=A0A4E9DVC8_GIBZA
MSDRSADETKMAAAKAENSTFEMDDDQALTPLKYAKFVKEFEAWYKEKSSKPQNNAPQIQTTEEEGQKRLEEIAEEDHKAQQEWLKRQKKV